jgi:hypothetical protein
MSQTFDLDAAVGDATAEPFRFTWGGQAFEMPAALSLPIARQLELIAAIENVQSASPAEISQILGLIIGEDLLARLSAARPLTASGLMKLLEAWMSFQSGDLGKSPVSLVSSAAMVRQSRPTSRSGRARRTS